MKTLQSCPTRSHRVRAAVSVVGFIFVGRGCTRVCGVNPMSVWLSAVCLSAHWCEMELSFSPRLACCLPDTPPGGKVENIVAGCRGPDTGKWVGGHRNQPNWKKRVKMFMFNFISENDRHLDGVPPEHWPSILLSGKMLMMLPDSVAAVLWRWSIVWVSETPDWKVYNSRIPFLQVHVWLSVY